MEASYIVIGVIFLGIGIFLGVVIGRLVSDVGWRLRLPKIREESVKKSREVIAGHMSEQLAPYLPGFPYSPNDARFIGKPIDLIVFDGLDSREPERIVFVEVKSGDADLSPVERKIRDLVKEKKVYWEEYRAPKRK